MTPNRRGILPELVVIGALSGFVGAWLLAIELAAIQGAFPSGGWMYGLFFGFPIPLVLSPIVVWVAEQVVLRSR